MKALMLQKLLQQGMAPVWTLQFLVDSTHTLAGQTVELPDMMRAAN